MFDGMTLEEAEAVLADWREYSKRRSIDGKFLYIKLTDLYEDTSTEHIVCKDKLRTWLDGLSITKETAYIYEAIEDNDGELIPGKFVQLMELNK
jgi:hypothetical protein